MCIILGVMKQGEAQRFCALLLRRTAMVFYIPFYILINAGYIYPAYNLFLLFNVPQQRFINTIAFVT